jgi:hypothetical protein
LLEAKEANIHAPTTEVVLRHRGFWCPDCNGGGSRFRGTDHVPKRPRCGEDVGGWVCQNNGGNPSGAGHHKGTGDKI